MKKHSNMTKVNVKNKQTNNNGQALHRLREYK